MPPQLRATLPRKNDQELRSYRFFLDVTAPAIASVFDAEFWLTDKTQYMLARIVAKNIMCDVCCMLGKKKEYINNDDGI